MRSLDNIISGLLEVFKMMHLANSLLFLKLSRAVVPNRITSSFLDLILLTKKIFLNLCTIFY